MAASKRAASDRAQRWGDAIERRETRDAARKRFQTSAKRSRRVAADGLVVAAYLSVRDDGRLVQLRLPGVGEPPESKRGEIDGFSDASRRRLMELLHSIRRDAALPSFITLTFPEEIRVTPREAKQCLLAWAKRMRRVHGAKWCYIWRLEAHPKMSRRLGRVHPHLHLLTWGAWYDLSAISEAWTSCVWEVLGVVDGLHDWQNLDVREKHVRAGTNCERMRCWGGVIYSGKNYLGKEEDFPLGAGCGRIWGVWNKAALPLAKERRITLTWAQATCARLAVEAWMREKRIVSEHLICTFFTDDPHGFAARLLDVRSAVGMGRAGTAEAG